VEYGGADGVNSGMAPVLFRNANGVGMETGEEIKKEVDSLNSKIRELQCAVKELQEYCEHVEVRDIGSFPKCKFCAKVFFGE